MTSGAETPHGSEDPDWQMRLAALVGNRVREIRTHKRMSAQDVADHCTEKLGFRLLRTTLANLEAGTRKNVTLGEVLVLSEALGVSPATLLYPLIGPEAVEYLPGYWVSPWEARSHLTHPMLQAVTAHGDVPDSGEQEDQALHLLAQLETLQAAWLEYFQNSRNERYPAELRDSFQRQLQTTSLAVMGAVQNLDGLGVNLSDFNSDMIRAAREIASELERSGESDASPSA